MVMGGCKGLWEGMITFRRCDSPQGSVKDVRKVCQLIERCNAHWRIVQELGYSRIFKLTKARNS